MGTGSDLREAVAQILNTEWKTRDGQQVPESEDVSLGGNEAVELEGTVLYADLAGSTRMVDGYKSWFAAKIYKAYLHCAATLVRTNGGTITAYDGDRIMAVFMGKSKNTSAVRTGLAISWAVSQVINPAIANHYPKVSFRIQQVVGIDTSPLFIARTGVRGANDLVWVGRSANYAAKLTELPPNHHTVITDRVFDNMNESVKTHNGQSMWTRLTWAAMNNAVIYGSTWYWGPD